MPKRASAYHSARLRCERNRTEEPRGTLEPFTPHRGTEGDPPHCFPYRAPYCSLGGTCSKMFSLCDHRRAKTSTSAASDSALVIRRMLLSTEGCFSLSTEGCFSLSTEGCFSLSTEGCFSLSTEGCFSQREGPGPDRETGRLHRGGTGQGVRVGAPAPGANGRGRRARRRRRRRRVATPGGIRPPRVVRRVGRLPRVPVRAARGRARLARRAGRGHVVCLRDAACPISTG